jgi:sodium/potassium-transporting ATPase subunit alpha
MTADKPAEGKQSGMQAAIKGAEAIRSWDEHRIPLDELCKRLNTNKDTGLSQAQADKLIETVGTNELSKKEQIPWYCLFLHEFTGFFSLLLEFGAVLCIVAYAIQKDQSDKSNLYLGVVLAAVVFITAVFSYQQASKSAEMMAQFENFIPPKGNVIRDGKKRELAAKDMVPGDVVNVKGGENIPCDLVIFKSNEMKVNNASLTGEPIEILMAPEVEPSDSILESQCASFFGTQCTEGSGTGICIRTGDRTFIGQIANLASEAEAEETPLSIEINRFILIISAVAIFLGVSFLILSVVIGYEVIQSIVFMIGIIVANVPEGLLATVTLSLALTATRMAEKFVLVKNLEAVETLGSTSCICSDKTGTLTQNRMTVSHLFVDRESLNADVNWQVHQRNQAKEHPDEHIIPGYDLKDAAFMELTKAMVLSSSTFFTFDPTDDDCKKLLARVRSLPVSDIEDKDLTPEVKKEMRARLIVAEKRLLYINRFCKGDASETGLVQFAQPILDLEETRSKYPVHKFMDGGKETECMIPFSSQIKFNCFIRDMKADNGHLRVYLKGAPERVIERCNKIMTGSGIQDFSQTFRDEVDQANVDFGGMGERVLAFAYLDLDPSKFNGDYKFNMKGWKDFGEAYKGVSYESYKD